jgi:hypothetical protein
MSEDRETQVAGRRVLWMLVIPLVLIVIAAIVGR